VSSGQREEPPTPDRSEGDVNVSRLRTEWVARNVNEETRRLLEDDARYFLHQALSTPCLDVLVSARGSTIADLAGKEYLDFHGNSVHQVGYGHPAVLDAIREQLRTLPFCPRRYTNVPAIDLARTLAGRAPGKLRKVLFAPAGALAVSTAIKLARIATGRSKTISFQGSFHGASLDTISIGGEEHFRAPLGPLLPGAIHVPPPVGAGPSGEGVEDDLRSAAHLEHVMEKEGGVAAVIAEPIRSTTVAVPHPSYWRRVREACDRHGALLVFDEIPLSLGRTGRLFACEHFDVAPDLLCLGKGLGGGVFPMAALLAREDLDVAASTSLGHYTHEKSPVGAAAALATLGVIDREGLLERARRMGSLALDLLRDLASRSPLVAEVRGLGLALAVELEDLPGLAAAEAAERVLYGALERGLSFKVSDGNVLTLMPPLTVTEEELRRAVGILDSCLAEVHSGSRDLPA
jgi:4-aminobutyrate aminotransferase